MQIRLVREKIENFKGIKDLSIEFSNNVSIYGNNGLGKTSIYDAYLWCLFGKDSQDKKDFEIKPLDSNNNPIHHLETRVELTLSVDGVEKVFTRILKEKWVKHKGQAEANLEGSVQEFYIDDVPQKLKDFNSKVNELMDSEVFKLVSNPLYFASLNWKKQREILFEIIGDISDGDVINYKSSLKKLGELLGNSSVENFRKKTKAQIIKLKKDRDGIPSRIDECNKQKSELDWLSLEIEKRTLLSKVKKLDLQISDSSKANEGKAKLIDELSEKKSEYMSKLAEAKGDIQQELFNVKAEYNDKLAAAKLNADKPLRDIEQKIKECEIKVAGVQVSLVRERSSYDRINNDIESSTKTYNKLTTKKEKLLEEYHTLEDTQFTFDETLSHCPTCGREYDNVEEIKAKAEETFNKDKKIKLEKIVEEGKRLAEVIEQYKFDISAHTKELDVCKECISQLETKIDYYSNDLYSLNNTLEELKKSQCDIDFEGAPELRKEIADLSVKLNNPTFEGQEELKASIEGLQANIQAFKDADNSLLIKEKESLQTQIEDITRQLALKYNNDTLDKRISELQEEEKSISIKIAELEGQDFMCEEFTRTKVELLEDKINSKFKTLRFKLFNQLVNGGLEECCSILVNGVPYNSVNTAGRINAGIEMINALCQYYDVSSAIWLDNRESVNKLVDTNSQVINLVVSSDDTLRIENLYGDNV